MQRYVEADLGSASGRALVEERYWSLRRQVPIVYLLGFVNVCALEVATSDGLSVGLNLPTFVGTCGLIRLGQWFGRDRGTPSHEQMIRRMRQTVWFAAAVCLAVCGRCLYLMNVDSGDAASQMAVMLFGGLTAIGVAYGLTALPAAGRIPLLLIIGPISVAALVSSEPRFAGAAFGLVVAAALTLRLLNAHSRHFTDVIKSRSVIVHEQQRVQHAHQEALVAATTDFLTGLLNRRAFVAALDAATSEQRKPLALAILDLDRFKSVNDTFGHAVGDQLLKEVASRLLRAVGTRGIVARLGGDEFGILLPNVGRAKDAQAIGSEILAGVNGDVVVVGRPFVVAACCGIGISRRKQLKSPSRLMADADLALYQAKANPSHGLAVFELRMEAPRRRRTQIESALQRAGIKDHLQVVFQPIFNLGNGQVIANEALARWSDPELGSIGPSEFVPIAEQLNLIEDINDHLMQLAFRSAHEWEDHVKLAFNLSAIQICSSGSAKRVLGAMSEARINPARLQVEVTETALLADFDRARENLTELRQAGATIVLDDFGAGYASIGYLREIEFDQIKLDGGLVTAARQTGDGKRLLRAVIGLCEILGVSTVAEHVESEELLLLVTELGCTAAQGFWLCPPVPAEGLRSRHATIPERTVLPSRAA